MDSVRRPLAAAALALVGALLAAAYVHVSASAALEVSLEQRLEGIGLALSTPGVAPDARSLRELMAKTALEAAYVVGEDRRVVVSAAGSAGAPVDLLRVDPEQLQRAFAGSASEKDSYAFGAAEVVTAYFPIRGADGGEVRQVLVLEAGRAFTDVRRRSTRALLGAVVVSLVGAGALALVAARWAKTEALKRQALGRAAQAEALRVIAAAAAHEIRNPLGVIRGTVDLMRERIGATLAPRDAAALTDIVEEVHRLRQLTDDLLELSADKQLTPSAIVVTELLADLTAFARTRSGTVELQTRAEVDVLHGDPLRVGQILRNLLGNAVDAHATRVELTVQRAAAGVQVVIQDDGDGIPAALHSRLFDPFATGKSTGTGLGLALSRRLAERHGGALTHVPTERGARFELYLPHSAEES